MLKHQFNQHKCCDVVFYVDVLGECFGFTLAVVLLYSSFLVHYGGIKEDGILVVL